MLDDISDRCNTIEECYEFMLAYAAQGLLSDQGSQSGGQIREWLGRAAEAVGGLARSCETALAQERLEPAERYQNFFQVVRRDAGDSLAAIELVLAQPSISSQLIDNLNASIHLRALLTDLFLLTEIAKALRAPAQPAASC
ncbi:MAG: hypothetical protein ACRD5R_03770 [Candidatus Acidiferrales bacterium]